MPRVASLYLPQLAIERIRPSRAAPPQPEPRARTLRFVPDLPQAEEGECSVRRGGGWRPGAKWARDEMVAEIEVLPAHQRPPMRELGRRSEALPAPFRDRNPSPVPGEGGARDPQDRGRVRERPHPEDSADRSLPRPASLREAVPLPQAGEGLSPLVLSTRAGQKLVVAAACPAARALGLAPGMALSMARALVPGLEVRDADHQGDAHLIERLAVHAARRWSPLAAADGDGLWLDLSTAPLFGGELRMARRILRFLARRGFTARIAVADTAGAAHALARHAAAPILLCPPAAQGEALAALPVEALRIAADAAASLRRLGVETVADLAAMPRAPLVRRFGRAVADRLDQALGLKGEPIDGVTVPELPQEVRRFAEPIATAEAIALVLADLTAGLCARLLALGRGARRVALVCRRVDNHDQIVAIGTAKPTRDARHLLRLLTPKIEEVEPGFGIEAMRLVALSTDRLGPEAVAQDLAADGPDPDLAPLIDILAGRIGARRLSRPTLVESDVPERSVAAISPLASARGWPPHWQRPARLLDPPERVDHVIAELPDQPPRRFSWRGQPHVVARADGPERIHGEWWRRSGEADAIRDYFQVEDAEGRRFWLFRRGDGLDARTGDLSWWLQGAFG